MAKSEVVVVVGGQWGDEGKGKITDTLAEDSILGNSVAEYEKGDIHKNWGQDFQGAQKWADLPLGFQKLVLSIVKTMPGAKLAFIGTGPRREDLVRTLPIFGI